MVRPDVTRFIARYQTKGDVSYTKVQEFARGIQFALSPLYIKSPKALSKLGLQPILSLVVFLTHISNK